MVRIEMGKYDMGNIYINKFLDFYHLPIGDGASSRSNGCTHM